MYIPNQMPIHTISDLTTHALHPSPDVFFSEKSINISAFNEQMTTRKKSDIRIFFRDTFPSSILQIITKINGVVTAYSNPADAVQYASVSGGELTIKAPPNIGDETLVHTRKHSVFQPNNGKRFSTSLFYDHFNTGEYEIGFGNYNETNLDMQDAILMRVDQGIMSGRIFSNNVEKVWPGGATANIVTNDSLNGLEYDPVKGHLFDIQAQLRNIGNIYYFISGKTSEGPREILQFNGLNNQDNVTVSNAAMHGIFIARNNGIQSQLRVGCLDISNETDDEDVQEINVFSNDFDVNCPTTGAVLKAIRNPFSILNNLNTQDAQYYSASVFADKRARVKIFRIDNPALLTKTVDGVQVPLVDTDWTQYPGSALQYIDNSQASGVPRLITGFTETGLRPIAQAGFAVAGQSPLTAPDIRRVPITMVHGEIFVVVGYGRTAAASMSLDHLYLGAGV